MSAVFVMGPFPTREPPASPITLPHPLPCCRHRPAFGLPVLSTAKIDTLEAEIKTTTAAMDALADVEAKAREYHQPGVHTDVRQQPPNAAMISPPEGPPSPAKAPGLTIPGPGFAGCAGQTAAGQGAFDRYTNAGLLPS